MDCFYSETKYKQNRYLLIQSNQLSSAASQQIQAIGRRKQQ